MSTNFELRRNKLPKFNFRLPLPQTPIDYLRFSFEKAKNGKTLVLTVNITYELEDFDSKDKYEVTKFKSIYNVFPEEETFAPAKLYEVCKNAADMFNACLEFLASNEVPSRTIPCPPICHLQEELLGIIGWYNAPPG